jgi:hypothetical protein
MTVMRNLKPKKGLMNVASYHSDMCDRQMNEKELQHQNQSPSQPPKKKKNAGYMQ